MSLSSSPLRSLISPRAIAASAVLSFSIVAPASAQSPEPAEPAFTLSGYVEAYYQWSFANPDNGVTNLRGFDNRHNSFTLSNVALDAQYERDALIGRVALQVGAAPSTYYLAEPSLPGAGGANASSAETWKLLQQAYAGYRFDVGRGLTVAAGLFLSPIGPESIAVRDNWSWSRSNLFFGLPFYHAGVRATYPLSDALTAAILVSNGWNNVVDGNREKSVSAQLTYARPALTAQVLYFGGVERPPGAPEGRAWRHLFDAHATWHATSRLSWLAHASAGVEPNDLGTSRWLAAAVASRLQICAPLFLAARADAFSEHVPDGASALFWPVPWVASATLTADLRPHPRASLRLELRHDRADGDLFFGGDVATDSDGLAIPDRASQTTATLGATTWF